MKFKTFIVFMIKLLIFKSVCSQSSEPSTTSEITATTTTLQETSENTTTTLQETSENTTSTTNADDESTTTSVPEIEKHVAIIENLTSGCGITSFNHTINENFNLNITWRYSTVLGCNSVQVLLKNLTCEAKCNITDSEIKDCQANCTEIRNVTSPTNYLRSPFSLKSCTRYQYVLIFENNTLSSAEFWSSLPELKNINISDSFRNPDTKILDLDVSWEYEANCTENFVVSIQYESNESEKTVTASNAKFEDVLACANYTVTIRAQIESNFSVNYSTFYATKSIEPSEIRNLNASSVSKSIGDTKVPVLEVKWDPPAQGSRCVKNYKIFLESEFDNRTENVASCSNDCGKEIFEVYPCVSYSVRVEASLNETQEEKNPTLPPQIEDVLEATNDQSNQSNIVHNVVVDAVVFGKLDQPNITDQTNTTFELSTIVNTTKNKCDILKYEFQCINEALNLSRTEMTNTSSIIMKELEPDTQYSCSVKVLNEAGWSEQGSKGSFKTLEGSPNAPNFTVINESIKSTEFTLVWEKPTKPRGEIVSYVVYIKFNKFLHRNPDYCPSKPNASEYEKTFYVNEKNDTEYTFSEAILPSSEYLIQMRANTKIEGEWSTLKTLKTKTDKSEAVLLKVAQNPIELTRPYNNTAILSWVYPCKANSNLTAFEIHHSSGNQIPVKTNITFENGKYNYEYGLDLTPSFSYNIKILPYSDEFAGKESESNFTLDAGVPEDSYIKSIVKSVIIQNIAKQTVTLRRLQNLFNSSVGRVEHIIFLLHQTDCGLSIEKKRNFISFDNSDEIPNYSDPSKSKCIGQYKTAKILNPSDGIETFTIGYESCNNQPKQICNGPLKPGTHYALIMRFFTKNGFADSEMIKFDTDKQTPIALIIISFLTIICIVFVIGFYITYRNPRNSVNTQFDREDVPVQNFHQFYSEMTKNNNERIREEYKQIQFFSEGLDKTTLASKVNEKYNRYANISPFDSNRVVLNDDEFENDYINASFVNGYYYSKEYIAAQGPKTNTSHDFWRMVLQYKTESIVMLTSLVENNKVKCHEYFPRLNGQVTFDNIKIVCVSEQKHPSFIKRIMEVQKNDMKHIVKHYYFLKWMDHSACNASDLIDFIKVVRSERQNPSESFIVHCSAGVGRTGTFIALDILLQRIKQERKVNIFVLVKELRKQRMKMVQTFDQYALVYSAALEMTTSRTRRPRVLQNISMYIENIELFKNWTRRGNLRSSDEISPKVDDKESAL